LKKAKALQEVENLKIKMQLEIELERSKLRNDKEIERLKIIEIESNKLEMKQKQMKEALNENFKDISKLHGDIVASVKAEIETQFRYQIEQQLKLENERRKSEQIRFETEMQKLRDSIKNELEQSMKAQAKLLDTQKKLLEKGFENLKEREEQIKVEEMYRARRPSNVLDGDVLLTDNPRTKLLEKSRNSSICNCNLQ